MLVILAVLMASKSKPLPLKEAFQWNVSLVEVPPEPSIDSTVQAVRPPAKVPQPEIWPMKPATARTPEVAPDVHNARRNAVHQQPPSSEAPNVLERTPVQETEKPVSVQEQQKVVAQTLPSNREVAPVQEPQRLEQISDPIGQPTPLVEVPSLGAQASTALHAEAPVQAKEIPPSVGEEFTHPAVTSPQAQRIAPAVEARVEPEPAQTATVLSEPVALAEPMQAHAPLPTPMAMLPREATAPRMTTQPDQPLTKAVQPTSAARADYGWLIDSIGKRLAELKRYPAAARLNGWEGKVVLRAVINADGNLTEVNVKKSSGYKELDAAAMEVLRQACPLSMRQALGRPDIVVNIPVVYALAQ